MTPEPIHFVRSDGLTHQYLCPDCQRPYYASDEEESRKRARESAKNCAHGSLVLRKRRVNHAEKDRIDEIDGPCFGSDGQTFYNSVEEAMFAGETIVVEAKVETYRIEIDSFIENMLEEHHEDAGPSDLNGLEDLEKAIHIFNEKQSGGTYRETKNWQELEYMRTFAIIKPCAQASGKSENIKKDIMDAGFTIEDEAITTLTRNDAEWLYREHSKKDHFNDLVEFTISGPVTLMILASKSKSAPEDFRALMGPSDVSKAAPETLRGKYAEDFRRNGIHGSDGNASAQEELEYFEKNFDRA